ncbi:MAG: hypothetical protein PHU46_13700 [Rhodocyclaceae bacterium]|nr:hypothetical protein [Rhodocyclaceae bacterium]
MKTSASRTQALADGTLIDLMDIDPFVVVCRRHYPHPIMCTEAVYDAMQDAIKQSDSTRLPDDLLDDILNQSRVNGSMPDPSTVIFRTFSPVGELQDFKLCVFTGENGEPVIILAGAEEEL